MLTLQYVPHSEIEALETKDRINKILKIIKDNKVALLEGRLKKHEETQLISQTMSEIGGSFKGIELATIESDISKMPIYKKLAYQLLIGDRSGLTVIGPATVVKEIKRDPNKLQLMMTAARKRRRR